MFVSVNAPLPAEDTKDKVEHEEGADDDEGNEVDPVEVTAHRVIRLEIMGRIENCKRTKLATKLGAKTVSIMTLSTTTVSITTLSIMTLNTSTLSIMKLSVKTLS